MSSLLVLGELWDLKVPVPTGRMCDTDEDLEKGLNLHVIPEAEQQVGISPRWRWGGVCLSESSGWGPLSLLHMICRKQSDSCNYSWTRMVHRAQITQEWSLGQGARKLLANLRSKDSEERTRKQWVLAFLHSKSQRSMSKRKKWGQSWVIYWLTRQSTQSQSNWEFFLCWVTEFLISGSTRLRVKSMVEWEGGMFHLLGYLECWVVMELQACLLTHMFV